MVDVKARVISNKEIAKGFFKITLEAPEIAEAAKAGQFVMVRCSSGADPLLRRPFSFHAVDKKEFKLLYQVVGKGTEILSKRKRGERLPVLGPLGNGFDTGREIETGGYALLVAGGMGVAPLLELAKQVASSGRRFAVYIGAKAESHVLCDDEFNRLGAEVYVATEDGSKGHKGLVTDLLNRAIRGRHRARRITIHSCGPHPMLREVAKIARSKKIHCEVSLEEKMACGTGACLGCAVETKKGFKMACKDGPVFDAREIIW